MRYRQFSSFVRLQRPAVQAMSYGGDVWDLYRLSGTYTGTSQRREAGNLPVQQSTKVRVIVNLKTAKALETGFAAETARPSEVMKRRDVA